MNSTRERILRTLLAFPGSTINDLAEAVGINSISIRHHLTTLEAEDLVTSDEERHGVGRPRLIYSLTEKGVEEFPTSYLRLTTRLLNNLKRKLSSEEIKNSFADIGKEIAKSYASELNGTDLEERIQKLKSILTKEGFIIELTKNDDGYTLTSLSCPYYRIGQVHPEICAMDFSLISTILAVPITVKSCILDHADKCVYEIPFIKEEPLDV